MHGYYREKLQVNHFFYCQQPLRLKVRKTTLLNTHLLQDLVLPLSLGVKRTTLVLYSKLHSSHIVHQIWEESYHHFESCGEKNNNTWWRCIYVIESFNLKVRNVNINELLFCFYPLDVASNKNSPSFPAKSKRSLTVLSRARSL